MKRRIYRLAGAVLAILLTFSLCATAFADGDGDGDSDDPPQGYVPGSGQGGSSGEGGGNGDSDDPPQGYDPGSGEGGGGETPQGAADETFRQLEDGSYVLVGHTGSESLQSDGDITIYSAGLNHISSISGAGKIRIAGTGILIVDSLEGELELYTFTDIYDEGCAAVFLKQDDGTYLLINGSVPGILDEEYSVSGLTLVMPSESSLLLCGTGAEAILDEDGNVVSVAYYHGTEHTYKAVDYNNLAESVGKLTIGANAALKICDGAAVLIEDLKSLQSTGFEDHLRRPELNVTDDGVLDVSGAVEGGGFVNFSGADCTLTGNGSITADKITADASVVDEQDITFSADTFEIGGSGEVRDLMIEDCEVCPQSSQVTLVGLQSSGESSIYIPPASEIMIASVNGTLSFKMRYNPVADPALNESEYRENVIIRVGGAELADGTTGICGSGTVVFSSGYYALIEGTELCGVTVSNSGYGNLYDYAGVTNSNIFPLHIKPDEVTRADENGGLILIEAMARYYDEETAELIRTELFAPSVMIADSGGAGRFIPPYVLNGIVNGFLGTDEALSVAEVEILHFDGGRFYTTKYSQLSLEELVAAGTPIAADDICLIRVDCSTPASIIMPVGPATQTSTSYTGTGILGGVGAGSVNIGGGTSVNPGSGDNNSSGNGDNNNSGNGDNNSSGNGNNNNSGNGDNNSSGNGENNNSGSGDNNNSGSGNNNNSGSGENNNSGDGENSNSGDEGEKPDGGENGENGENGSEGGNGEDDQSGNSAAAALSASVWVESLGDGVHFVLRASDGENTLKRFGGRASVRMSYTPPAGYVSGSFYLVFRNGDGSLTAIKASYSELLGELRFETDRLGEFTVAVLDFDGEEFSPEFYEALAALIS